MRRAPRLVCGLVVLMASSASAADRLVGVVGGGLFNSMPNLLGPTIVDEPIFAQGPMEREFGPLGGLIYEVSWPTFAALRFEPKYMRKGTDLALRLQSGAEVSGPVQLDYVSLPILFKSTMFKSHPVQLVLVSGVSADYLASAKYEGRDVKDSFESWDFTVTARIGIQWKAGENGLLGVQFNVASSLAGIDKGQPDQAKLKNTGIGFAVEYTHRVGSSK
jgi:Outer membrane protein beta-barrel domain